MLIHDLGHVALRRGIRAAVGVPIAVGAAMWLLPGTPAAVIAAFGSVGLIATSDFGGTPRRRITSLLWSGLVGVFVITIGVAAGLNIVSAVLVTFLVGSVLAFSAVLHGSIASGAPAMTVIYVASTTIDVSFSKVSELLAGWLIGLAVSIPVVLLILPRRNTAPVRDAVSHALQVLSQVVSDRCTGKPVDISAVAESQERLLASYVGNPFRASGLNPRDRALIVLAGQIEGLHMAMLRRAAYLTPMSDQPVTRQLVMATSTALDDLASALSGDTSRIPTGLTVAELWQSQWEEATAVLANAQQSRGVRDVYDLFPDRAMAISTVRLVMLGRRVLGLPAEHYPSGGDQHTIPTPPVATSWGEIRAQATLKSPWGRLALRTGVGLSIAVLVVSLMGIAHGFWVVLGVIAILRFDSLTTVKSALLAIIGTFVGAAAGFGVLLVDFDHLAWLWVGLVVATFLAVWAQAAIGFVAGQAAFSMFVIIAFSIINWPPELRTATDRIVDIVIGALVSLIVAFLLWPRGVLRGMLGNISEAIRASNRLLREAVGEMVQGDVAVDGALLNESTGAIVRSQEVIDLSLTSSSPGASGFAHDLQRLIDDLRTPVVAGHLIADWARDRPPIAQVVPALRAPLEAELDAVTAVWEDVAQRVDGGTGALSPPTSDNLATIADITASLDLRQPVIADRAVAAVWTQAWLVMSRHAGESCTVPTRN